MGNYVTMGIHIQLHHIHNNNRAMSTQEPSTHQHGKPGRIDCAVEKIDSVAPTVETVLFLEATRASALPSDTEVVEYKVFTAVSAYFVETSVKHVLHNDLHCSSPQL